MFSKAMRSYEDSLRLDPQAVPVMKALLLLYIAIERYDDAIALARRALEQDPHDYHISFLYARQLRSKGKLEEACAILASGV